jgi:hypothetical protein
MPTWNAERAIRQSEEKSRNLADGNADRLLLRRHWVVAQPGILLASARSDWSAYRAPRQIEAVARPGTAEHASLRRSSRLDEFGLELSPLLGQIVHHETFVPPVIR